MRSRAKLKKQEFKIIGQGLFIVLAFVSIGIIAAEAQMNQLTHHHSNIGVLNFSTNEGVYKLSLLGATYQASLMLPVGDIHSAGTDVYISLGRYACIIPTYVTVDKKELVNAAIAIETMYSKVIIMLSEMANKMKILLLDYLEFP